MSSDKKKCYCHYKGFICDICRDTTYILPAGHYFSPGWLEKFKNQQDSNDVQR